MSSIYSQSVNAHGTLTIECHFSLAIVSSTHSTKTKRFMRKNGARVSKLEIVESVLSLALIPIVIFLTFSL